MKLLLAVFSLVVLVFSNHNGKSKSLPFKNICGENGGEEKKVRQVIANLPAAVDEYLRVLLEESYTCWHLREITEALVRSELIEYATLNDVLKSFPDYVDPLRGNYSQTYGTPAGECKASSSFVKFARSVPEQLERAFNECNQKKKTYDKELLKVYAKPADFALEFIVNAIRNHPAAL